MRYSVVIPVYNEERSILSVYSSVKEVMQSLQREYEIIFVNDGSEDNSLTLLKAISFNNDDLKLVSLDKNYGESFALQSGFDNASGEIIISMDGDGQFEPRDIPRLLGKLNKDYDVVCGWRHKRQDPRLRIISSRIANLIRRLLVGEKIHDVGCSFRVYRKDCVKNLGLKGPMQRFIVAILLKNGCRIAEVKVSHYPRISGNSNYNIRNRLFNSLTGMINVLRYKKKAGKERGKSEIFK